MSSMESRWDTRATSCAMIGENQSNLSFEFSSLLALQKVFEAMRQARREQRDFRNVIVEMEFKLHSELLSHGTELRGDLITGNVESVQMKLEARQEDSCFDVGVLVRLKNIAAVAEDEAGDS